MKKNFKQQDKARNGKDFKKGSQHGSRARKDDSRDYKTSENIMGTHNDPKWYVENEQMLKDVASLPFAQVLGLDTGLYKEGSGITYGSKLPGIMAFKMEMSLGCGKTAVDAATLTARRIYSYVRHANSGSANYESPDLMMYILAYASAEAWLAAMKRAYGLAQQYYVKNRYFAAAMLNACGFPADEVIHNLAQLRAHINLTAARMNSLKVPAGMPIVERWKWLCSNVFMDDDDIKAQAYVFKFPRYARFSATTNENGSELRFPDAPKSNSTIDDIYAFTETLLEPLLSNEDIGIMSGDIMKAYGSNVTVEEMIGDNYVVLPTHDKEVLMQIHNTFIPFVAQPEHAIYQEGGVIKEYAYGEANSAVRSWYESVNGHLLDYYGTPEPSNVIVMTRNVPVVEVRETTLQILACGSEYVYGADVIRDPEGFHTDAVSSVLYSTDISAILAVSCFNWHPITYIAESGGNQLGVLGDLENYTVIAPETLSAMHRNAIFAELRTNSGN